MNLIERLWQLGFSPYSTLEEAMQETSAAQIEDMADLYCERYNLQRWEFVGHLNGARMCALPDVMQLGSEPCQFSTVNVKWCIVACPPSIDPAFLQRTCEQAAAAWAAVSGLRPVQTLNQAEANVLITHRQIDGPQRVLADCELPCNGRRVVRLCLDNTDQWTATKLLGVITHEMGHAWGLEHSNDGGLMDPFYRENVLKPVGAQELAAIQRRYGPPSQTPTTPANPPPTPGRFPVSITVAADGTVAIPGYRVTPLA